MYNSTFRSDTDAVSYCNNDDCEIMVSTENIMKQPCFLSIPIKNKIAFWELPFFLRTVNGKNAVCFLKVTYGKIKACGSFSVTP